MNRFCKYCLVLCVGLLPAVLYGWTTPINISNTPDGRSRYPAIAVNKYNRIYVAWSDDYQTEWHRNNIYSSYSDDGTTWSDPILVSGDSTDWLSISDAACDIFNNPHVVWDDWAGSVDIYYSKWVNCSWTPEVNLSNSSDRISQHANIAIDSRNIVHIVWQEGASPGYGEIFYRYYDRAFWSDTINISHNPEPSGNPAMAIDLEDCIHVVWRDRPAIEGFGIFYSKFDGFSWSEPVKIPDTEDGCDVSIAADTLGYPHVAWTEVLAPQDQEIYYSFYNGSFWSNSINISHSSMTSVGGQCIAIDTYNRIYLFWGEGRAGSSQRDIYFSCIIGDVISKKVNISNTPDNVSSYTDITLDPNDNIHVVWSEGYPMDEIYYTYHSQTSVEEQDVYTFSTIRLLQNQPNPFSHSTTIYYQLPVISHVSLKIYSINGRLIRTLVDDIKHPGHHMTVWYGRDEHGKKVSGGIYFYIMRTADFNDTKKIILTHKYPH
ncbi:hypothetical protein KAX02_05110 [candidate division WOR-3 bacterium]|nr:hypothetical protein [candidate division WOR-3 bacterium]